MDVVKYDNTWYAVLKIDNREDAGSMCYNRTYHLLPIDWIAPNRQDDLKELLNKCIKVEVTATTKLPFIETAKDYYDMERIETVIIKPKVENVKLSICIECKSNTYNYCLENVQVEEITCDEQVFDFLDGKGYSFDDENLSSVHAEFWFNDFAGNRISISEYYSYPDEEETTK